MFVEFVCNQSGNKVRFCSADDIASMRKETGYTEVVNESKAKSDAQVDAKQEDGQSVNPGKAEVRKEDGKQEANVLKKRGRPARK